MWRGSGGADHDRATPTHHALSDRPGSARCAADADCDNRRLRRLRRCRETAGDPAAGEPAAGDAAAGDASAARAAGDGAAGASPAENSRIPRIRDVFWKRFHDACEHARGHGVRHGEARGGVGIVRCARQWCVPSCPAPASSRAWVQRAHREAQVSSHPRRTLPPRASSYSAGSRRCRVWYTRVTACACRPTRRHPDASAPTVPGLARNRQAHSAAWGDRDSRPRRMPWRPACRNAHSRWAASRDLSSPRRVEPPSADQLGQVGGSSPDLAVAP